MIKLISLKDIDTPFYQTVRLDLQNIWLKLFQRKNEIDRFLFGRFWPVKKYRAEYNSETILNSCQLYTVRNWEYPWALAQAGDITSGRILDAGCGHSLFTLYLGLKSNFVYAVDGDKWQMEKLCPFLAGLAGTAVHYAHGDLCSLYHRDAEKDFFKYIFCISVLEHLEEEVINGVRVNNYRRKLHLGAIKQMLDVLQPGGKLILTLQYGDESSDPRSFRAGHIKEIIECYKGNMVSLQGYDLRFTALNKCEMEWLNKEAYPFHPGRPTGTIGMVMMKKQERMI